MINSAKAAPAARTANATPPRETTERRSECCDECGSL
jgi:hypothetical protein